MAGELPQFDAAAAPTDGHGDVAGAPTTSPGGEAAAPSTPPQPQFVTREDLAAILTAKDRQWQSVLDKKTAALNRQLQAQTLNERAQKAALAAGVTIPPEKQAAFVKSLQDEGVLGSSASSESAGSAGSGDDGDSGGALEVDPVSQQGHSIAAMYGLNGDDPEAKEIKVGEGVTPAQYLQSITLAGQKKLARTNQPNPAQMPGLTPAGGPPAKPDLSKKTRSQLLQAEVAQAMRKR